MNIDTPFYLYDESSSEIELIEALS